MQGEFGGNAIDVVLGGPPSVGSECCLPTCAGLACLACGCAGGVYFERERNEVPRKGVTDGVREGRLVVIQGEKQATGDAGVKIIDKGLYNSLWDWCCDNPAYTTRPADKNELVKELVKEFKTKDGLVEEIVKEFKDAYNKNLVSQKINDISIIKDKKNIIKDKKKLEKLKIQTKDKISIKPTPLTAEQLIDRLKKTNVQKGDWGKIILLITEHIGDIDIDDILKILTEIFKKNKLGTDNKIKLLIKIINSMDDNDKIKALENDKFYNFILEVLLQDEFLHRKKKKQVKSNEEMNLEEEEEEPEEEEEQPEALLKFFIKIFPMMIKKMSNKDLKGMKQTDIDRLLLLLMEYYNINNINLPQEGKKEGNEVNIINNDINIAPEGKNETIKFNFLFKLIEYYNKCKKLPDVDEKQLEALFNFVSKIIGEQKEVDKEPNENEEGKKERQRKLLIMQNFASSIAKHIDKKNWWKEKVKQAKQGEINFPRSEPPKPPVSNKKLKEVLIKSNNIDLSLPAEKPKEKSKVTELKIDKSKDFILTGKKPEDKKKTGEKNIKPILGETPTNLLIKKKSNHQDFIRYKDAKGMAVVNNVNNLVDLSYRFSSYMMQPPIIFEDDINKKKTLNKKLVLSGDYKTKLENNKIQQMTVEEYNTRYGVQESAEKPQINQLDNMKTIYINDEKPGDSSNVFNNYTFKESNNNVKSATFNLNHDLNGQYKDNK